MNGMVYESIVSVVLYVLCGPPIFIFRLFGPAKLTVMTLIFEKEGLTVT